MLISQQARQLEQLADTVILKKQRATKDSNLP